MVATTSFLTLVRSLNRHEVAYVLIGGLALLAQGLPRTTPMKRHTYRPQDQADARLLAETFGLEEE